MTVDAEDEEVFKAWFYQQSGAEWGKRPGQRWHLPALPTALTRQFLPILTTLLRSYRFAVIQLECLR